MTFKKASNFERKLRMAIIGPAKSGKSYTALTLACALAGEQGKVAVIDTENASAAKYAEWFPVFDVSELERYHPDDYVREIQEAERAGYDVLIIDSLSHAWNGPGGLLEFKEQIARSNKPGMNSYTAWAEATPKHTKLMHAITHTSMHIIVTMRTKIEYVLEEDGKGRTKPVRVGLAPIQREDTEYEFDIMAMMDREHTMSVEGSRCPGLDNVSIPKPGPEVAETLKEWLRGEPVDPFEHALRQFKHAAVELYPSFARTPDWFERLQAKLFGEVQPELNSTHLGQFNKWLVEKREEKAAKAS